MKNYNYLKTNNKTEEYEPFILGEKEIGQVHWLTDKNSNGKTTYSGLWKCSSMVFEYEFPGDEIIYCIEGSLIIKMENNEEVIINEGDIVSFKKGKIGPTENNDYVAVSSEFQAMAHLPNVNKANIYETKPGVIYTWGK